MWRGVAGALAVLAMVGVTACGGDDDDATSASADPAESESASTGDGDSAGDPAADDTSDGDTSDGDAGDGEAGPGGGDFPIPAPDGLTIDALVDAGIDMSGQRQLYYPDDDLDRILAFYDAWTAQNGDWAKSEALGGTVYQTLEGDEIRAITITPDQDPGARAEGPAVFVLLVAEP